MNRGQTWDSRNSLTINLHSSVNLRGYRLSLNYRCMKATHLSWAPGPKSKVESDITQSRWKTYPCAAAIQPGGGMVMKLCEK